MLLPALFRGGQGQFGSRLFSSLLNGLNGAFNPAKRDDTACMLDYLCCPAISARKALKVIANFQRRGAVHAVQFQQCQSSLLWVMGSSLPFCEFVFRARLRHFCYGWVKQGGPSGGGEGLQPSRQSFPVQA